MADDSRPVGIGASSTNTSGEPCRVHSMVVWNVVLTQAEITSLYNQGRGSSTNPYVIQPTALKHCWLVGFGGNLGFDNVASGAISLNANAVNVTEAGDVVYDSPA